MHTIKLNVQDSIYGHIMFLLKNLNTKELEIVEDKAIATQKIRKRRLNAICLNTAGFKFDREEANAR
ncbi:MAG: hypothetical protein HXX81_06010 [Campylobacterales bacterium]|nr:hypothetical protein [Campylobacterales bacterium]